MVVPPERSPPGGGVLLSLLPAPGQPAGYNRRPDQTPAEFAAELAGHSAAFDEAPALVQAYYDVAFGGRRLSPEHNRSIEAFLEHLRKLSDRPSQPSAIVAGRRRISCEPLSPAPISNTITGYPRIKVPGRRVMRET